MRGRRQVPGRGEVHGVVQQFDHGAGRLGERLVQGLHDGLTDGTIAPEQVG